MRSILNEKSLKKKKILLRLYLKDPLENEKIINNKRIKKIIQTVNL